MKKEPVRLSKTATAQIKESRPDPGDLYHQLDMYKLIFNHIQNGCIVTDAEGLVTHFNDPYGVFLDVDPAEQIGKHCTKVVENTRMHIVAKTGKPEISQPHLIKGQRMVVQRIPIKQNGKVIAVLGQVMFKDVQDVRKLAQKLSHLESKVTQYERELISLRSTRYTLDSLIGESRAQFNYAFVHGYGFRVIFCNRIHIAKIEKGIRLSRRQFGHFKIRLDGFRIVFAIHIDISQLGKTGYIAWIMVQGFKQ